MVFFKTLSKIQLSTITPMTTAFTTTHVWKDEDFEISTEKARLDVPFICRWLSEESYWAKGRPHDVIRKTIDHSIPFGMYVGMQQVGFARVVTDAGVFAYVADVFVIPQFRGHGLGKWLVESILAHPDLATVTQLFLVTGDAHGLYSQYGFRLLNESEMERWMRCEDVME